MFDSGFTMRDKLRAESLKSLDTLLSRHYDPNKLRQYRLDRVQYVRDLGMGSFGNVFQGTLHLPHSLRKMPGNILIRVLLKASQTDGRNTQQTHGECS